VQSNTEISSVPDLAHSDAIQDPHAATETDRHATIFVKRRRDAMNRVPNGENVPSATKRMTRTLDQLRELANQIKFARSRRVFQRRKNFRRRLTIRVRKRTARKVTRMQSLSSAQATELTTRRSANIK
jgi:uncharacterized membrane protein YgaE (UPF0421/DUF939 family)